MVAKKKSAPKSNLRQWFYKCLYNKLCFLVKLIQQAEGHGSCDKMGWYPLEYLGT